MDSFYPIVVVAILSTDGTGYLAYVPDLKGCMSHGETPEQALANARKASIEWIQEAIAQGWVLPVSGQVMAGWLSTKGP